MVPQATSPVRAKAAAALTGGAHHIRTAVGEGQDREGSGATLLARRVAAGGRPAWSSRRARGAGADARPGAGSDPLRAHARFAVHVLPRRGCLDGGGSRGLAADGATR